MIPGNSYRASAVAVLVLLLGSLSASPALGQIKPEAVKKVKKATAYVKVEMNEGGSAEGSGFFAMEKGVVFTNAHVVGMLQASSKEPKTIEIVANSGQKDEFKMTGQILGVDRQNDLAVLRVQGEEKRWPEPLSVEADLSNLVELQKVYIFGFPFGAQLGKEITATESSISSFRKDVDGLLFQIQVNGGMNPGNSGGPVVDERGVVVGVSVAGIRGTQINFAVPGEKVQGLVNGRLSDVLMGHPFRDKQEVKVPVKMAFLDPLQRIREIQVDVWTGPKDKPHPASSKAPADRPGDSKKQALKVKYAGGKANLELAVVGELPKDHVYWLQPVFVNEAGVKQWAATTTFRPTDSAPLDHVDAKLVANVDPGERSLNLNSRFSFAINFGKKRSTAAMNMNLQVLETLEKNPKGSGVKLLWGKGEFVEEDEGRRKQMRPAVYNLIKSHVHGFACDDRAALTSFGFVKFNFKDVTVADDANDMAHNFITSYQMASLPWPNSVVKPQETWPAKIRLLVGREKKKTVMDVVLTCTYEGTRTVNGRKEAVVNLLGVINVLKSETPFMRKPSDRASGTAIFDVEKGLISKLKLNLRDEQDSGGILVETNFDVDLTREPGNTFNIVMPAPKK